MGRERELGPPQPPPPPPPGNDLGGSGRPQLAAASHFSGYREELRLPVSSRPLSAPQEGREGATADVRYGRQRRPQAAGPGSALPSSSLLGVCVGGV